MFSRIFSRNSTQTPSVLETAQIPVERQVKGNVSGSTEAQSSGNKRLLDNEQDKSSGTTPSKIIRFKLAVRDENEWDLPDDLAVYINRYMTTHASEKK